MDDGDGGPACNQTKTLTHSDRRRHDVDEQEYDAMQGDSSQNRTFYHYFISIETESEQTTHTHTHNKLGVFNDAFTFGAG